jgi:hypothetical protein
VLKKLLVALACAGALVTASPASAVDFGANDDTGKFAADGGSAFFGQMAAIGLKQNVMTVRWQPSAPTTIPDKAFLDRAVPRALAAGIKPIFAVYPYPPRELETLSAEQHAAAAQQFADWLVQLARAYPSVTTYIVGNEPNLNTFLRPQGDGKKVMSAAIFGPYLAAGYRALKSVNSGITVLGVGHSPRGELAPGANGKTAPVAFIKALGEWYRASGQTGPIMDGFSYHPYPNPSDFTVGLDWRYGWPNAGAQELDRIKQALWDAFNGTGQPTTVNGLKLYLDEVGWQTDVPGGAGYTDNENVRVASAEFQAEVYSQLVRFIVCDPDVAQLNFFGFYDERSLTGWQSALYYVNGQAKPSAEAVRRAIAETGGRCTGTMRTWKPETRVIGANATFPTATRVPASQKAFSFSVGAAEQATYTAAIVPFQKYVAGISRALDTPTPGLLSDTGELTANTKLQVKLSGSLPDGTYVYAVKLRAWANPARTLVFLSQPFTVGTGTPSGDGRDAELEKNFIGFLGNPNSMFDASLGVFKQLNGVFKQIMETNGIFADAVASKLGNLVNLFEEFGRMITSAAQPNADGTLLGDLVGYDLRMSMSQTVQWLEEWRQQLLGNARSTAARKPKTAKRAASTRAPHMWVVARGTAKLVPGETPKLKLRPLMKGKVKPGTYALVLRYVPRGRSSKVFAIRTPGLRITASTTAAKNNAAQGKTKAGKGKAAKTTPKRAAKRTANAAPKASKKR